jgi:hypothetical protein
MVNNSMHLSTRNQNKLLHKNEVNMKTTIEEKAAMQYNAAKRKNETKLPVFE